MDLYFKKRKKKYPVTEGITMFISHKNEDAIKMPTESLRTPLNTITAMPPRINASTALNIGTKVV